MQCFTRLRVTCALVAITNACTALAQSTSKDSAGVRIVENTRPAGRDWTVSPQPLVDIGSGEDTLYQLATVMGAVRLTSGHIAVAHMSTGNVRIYDARGRYIRALGRRGQGPGEFRQVMGVSRIPGDTIVVDDSRDEVELYSGDGKFLQGIRTPHVQTGLVVGGYYRFDDGSYARSSWPQGHDHGPGRWVDSLVVLRVSADSPEGTIISKHPAVEFTKTATLPFSQPVVFGPKGGIVTAGDGYYVGFAERYEIRFHRADGRLQYIIRAPWKPAPVPNADMERYKQFTINMGAEGGGRVDPRLLAQRQKMMDEVVFARQLPAYSVMKVDADRNLWVRSAYVETEIGQGWSRVISTPTTWRVFDRTGKWSANITLPARFNPMDIGTDYVLGLWRDEDDVEHVRMYRLNKPI